MLDALCFVVPYTTGPKLGGKCKKGVDGETRVMELKSSLNHHPT